MVSIQSCNRQPLADIPVTPGVTFDKHIRPITSQVCIKCHSQGSKDFSNYKHAYSFRYTIYDRVVVSRTMPQGIAMDDKDRALFRDWVNQGGSK